MQDKYIHKKYVDPKMKHDPLWLFENRRSKFDRFLRKKLKKAGIAVEDSEDEEEEVAAPKVTKIKSAPPAKTVPVPAPAPIFGDLINMASNDPSDAFGEMQSAPA